MQLSESNNIWKELNSLRIESWRGEKERLTWADQYDRDELFDMIKREDEEYWTIKELQNLEKTKREKQIHDHEVLKNVLKETAETMDVWNTWDKEVI